MGLYIYSLANLELYRFSWRLREVYLEGRNIQVGFCQAGGKVEAR
jgi:hypothetical protein